MSVPCPPGGAPPRPGRHGRRQGAQADTPHDLAEGPPSRVRGPPHLAPPLHLSPPAPSCPVLSSQARQPPIGGGSALTPPWNARPARSNDARTIEQDQGNDAFRAGRYQDAEKFYTDAMNQARFDCLLSFQRYDDIFFFFAVMYHVPSLRSHRRRAVRSSVDTLLSPGHLADARRTPRSAPSSRRSWRATAPPRCPSSSATPTPSRRAPSPLFGPSSSPVLFSCIPMPGASRGALEPDENRTGRTAKQDCDRATELDPDFVKARPLPLSPGYPRTRTPRGASRQRLVSLPLTLSAVSAGRRTCGGPRRTRTWAATRTP